MSNRRMCLEHASGLRSILGIETDLCTLLGVSMLPSTIKGLVFSDGHTADAILTTITDRLIMYKELACLPSSEPTLPPSGLAETM